MLYLNGWTLQKIGRKYGISRQAVHGVLKRAKIDRRDRNAKRRKS